MMDNEMMTYLNVMKADIMSALAQMESRILHAITSPPTRLDPLARKLEGLDDETTDPDIPRIGAGH
jgi:hypothetical protein